MLHEAGHQVAHLTGWNTELPAALRRGVPDAAVAELWAGWATELGPDLLAFAHSGYGAVAALHDVVAGENVQVFAHPIGDPHPIAWLRVLVGVEMCVRFYGTGPGDTLRQALLTTYPLAEAPHALRPMLERKAVAMCSGGRLVADFVAGTDARPGLPTTVNGLWVVWAHKLARQAGDLFVPLTGGSGYPADARAQCRFQGVRGAHDPSCRLSHAVSSLPSIQPVSVTDSAPETGPACPPQG